MKAADRAWRVGKVHAKPSDRSMLWPFILIALFVAGIVWVCWKLLRKAD